MREAVITADLDELLARIQEVEARDPGIAPGLRRLAESFQYQKLLDLFSPGVSIERRRKPKVPPARPASILAVDDTPANLQVLAGMLKDRGYKVRPVPSGKLALLAARTRSSGPDPAGHQYAGDERLRGVRTPQGGRKFSKGFPSSSSALSPSSWTR